MILSKPFLRCQGLNVLLFAWSTAAIPTRSNEVTTVAALQGRSGVLLPRKWSIDCSKDKDFVDLLKDELENAKHISKYGHDHFDDDSINSKNYLQNFVSANLRNIPDNYIVNQLREEYQHGSDMLGDSDNYEMKITCDNNSDLCKKGYYAHMGDKSKTMNICDAWWDPKGTPAEKIGAPYLEKTEDILKDCHDVDKTKFKTLENFWAGKAQALVHEVTHTSFFTGSDKTIDYCYGVQNSLNLAFGSYKVGKSRELKSDGTPLCPDPNDPTKPGFCNPDLSVDNADTLAIMAAGIWWSAKDQCHRQIDIGLSPQPPTANPADVPHATVDEPLNDPNGGD